MKIKELKVAQGATPEATMIEKVLTATDREWLVEVSLAEHAQFAPFLKEVFEKRCWTMLHIKGENGRWLYYLLPDKEDASQLEFCSTIFCFLSGVCGIDSRTCVVHSDGHRSITMYYS